MKNSVRSLRGLAFASVASLGLIAVTPAFAESQFVTAGTPTVANARLNFQVNVPRFLEFREHGRLVAVAVTDIVETALSAVYTFYDPDVPHASFGTYNIISTITHEKARDIAIMKSLGLSERTVRRRACMPGTSSTPRAIWRMFCLPLPKMSVGRRASTPPMAMA